VDLGVTVDSMLKYSVHINQLVAIRIKDEAGYCFGVLSPGT